MRFVSFRHGGRARYGVVKDGGVIDATDRLADRFTSLRDVIEGEALSELAPMADHGAPDVGLDEIEYLFPVTAPRKIFCIGRNYRAYHEVLEDGGAPEYPSVFPRYLNGFVPNGGVILRPRASDQLDYENEIGVVIGRRTRHVGEEDALSCVAGFTIVNEGSVRDWQTKGTQNCPGKNFYRSGSIGPWMATPDHLPDLDNVRIVTRRNGEVVQDGTSDMMICKIPFLISHISKFTELEPGDLIATGSPGGSIIEGGEPKNWLKAGDELEFEIEGIGVLQNTVADE